MEETRWEGQNFSEVVAPQEEEEEEEDAGLYQTKWKKLVEKAKTSLKL
jgi:hypothetical protein